MAHRVFRPLGTRLPLARKPTVETVGYSQTSLRDDGGKHDAVGQGEPRGIDGSFLNVKYEHMSPLTSTLPFMSGWPEQLRLHTEFLSRPPHH